MISPVELKEIARAIKCGIDEAKQLGVKCDYPRVVTVRLNCADHPILKAPLELLLDS